MNQKKNQSEIDPEAIKKLVEENANIPRLNMFQQDFGRLHAYLKRAGQRPSMMLHFAGGSDIINRQAHDQILLRVQQTFETANGCVLTGGG